MKVKIDKLSKNKNTFDTKLPLIGQAPIKPEKDKTFWVIDEDSEYGGLRTSLIQKVETTEDGWVLTTLNSIYKVEILEN